MLHAKNGVRINSVNPGYVLTDVYGKNFAPVRRFAVVKIILAAAECLYRCNSWCMTLPNWFLLVRAQIIAALSRHHPCISRHDVPFMHQKLTDSVMHGCTLFNQRQTNSMYQAQSIIRQTSTQKLNHCFVC